MNHINLFLLSSERSGSNLIRDRLCNYAENLCSVPPVTILRTLGYWEPLMGPFSLGSKWRETIGYALRCCIERTVPWDFTLSVDDIADDYERNYGNQRTIVRLVDLLYGKYAQRKGYTGYFNKEICLFDFAQEIERQLPNARFIHLYRDPRDYVLSQKKRPFGNLSALDLARLWLKECNASLIAKNSNGVHKKTFSVSYEQFIQDEQRVLKQIGDFFGIKAAAEKRSQNITGGNYKFHELKNVHRRTMRTNFNKYKDEMKVSEIRIVESVCWNTMRFLGYETYFAKRPAISPVEKYIYQKNAYLKTKFKHYRSRFKLRKEPINRWAAQNLVKELTAKYR